MAGLEDIIPSPIGFLFNANAAPGSPGSYSSLDMRRKIALAMMAQNKKGYPKNIGEGLTALGDALGERGLMNQLMSSEAGRDAILGRAAAQATGAVPAAEAAPAPAAVGAKTSYAAPGDMETDASGPVATAAPMDTVAGLTPEEVRAGVSSGGYNFNDAQAGGRFKPTPGYLQDAITKREPNPDMQAYYGGLSGVEAPKGARDISPTGAAGPYQFTQGTGRTYGIPGAARMDPGASTDAVRKFTADNAATFAERFGRPPTFRELAVMHQQGGQGGTNLLAGRSVPAENLAVNNMAGYSPGAAVAKMNRFYGMPNEIAPVSSRDAIASALAARPAALPPTSPMEQTPMQTPMPSIQGSAGGTDQAPAPDQRMAFAGLPPEISQGVSAAPPMASAIRPMPQSPPAQVAQAGQPPSISPPGTVYPPPATAPAEPRVQPEKTSIPKVPELEPKSPAQQANETALLKATAAGDPQLMDIYKTAIATSERDRQENYARRVEQYKAEMQSAEAAKARAESFRLATPQRELELQKAEDERQQRVKAEALNMQLGQIPQPVYIERLNKSQETLSGLPAAMQSVKRARDLVDNNKAYFGAGADLDTALSKLAGVAGFQVDPRASGTEQYKTAMGNIMAMSRKAIVGAGAQSEAELQLLQKTSAADAKLEPETIRQSLAAAEHLMLTGALQHQQQVRRFAGEEPQRQAQVYGQWAVPNDTMIDMVPKTAVAKLIQHANDPEVLRDFDNTFHTPGLSRDVLRRYGGQR